MNYWTKLSAEFAQQRNYLDELYKVYPITPNLRREISKDKERNPQTINRIAGNLYQMGFEEVIEKCTEPKETNRQIGPMFKQWVDKGVLGVTVYKDFDSFLNCNDNCILNMSDSEMERFAREYLGFKREKGIDFIAKFNNKYVIAETKFITDFGGHQNAQFDDAVRTQQSSFDDKKVPNEVIPIAIMDGVLYIEGNNKLYRYLTEHQNQIIKGVLVFTIGGTYGIYIQK